MRLQRGLSRPDPFCLCPCRFHQNAKRLRLRRGPGPVEVGRAASSLPVPELGHLGAGGGAHFVSARPVAGRKPTSRDALIGCEGKHLRKVRFDKGFRLVHDIVKQPVLALVREAAVYDLPRKGGHTLSILLALVRHAANHASQACSGPAVAAAPEVAVLQLPLAFIPHMRQEFFVRIPQPLLESLNLLERLVVITHRGQKRRRVVEAVRPHLRTLEDVVNNPIRAAWRLEANPFEQPGYRFFDLRIARPLGSLGVGRTAHCGVSGPAGVHHPQPAVLCSLYYGCLGQPNHALLVTGLQKRLRQNSLLPVAPLHGQRGFSGLFYALFAFGFRALPRAVHRLGHCRRGANQRHARCYCCLQKGTSIHTCSFPRRRFAMNFYFPLVRLRIISASRCRYGLPSGWKTSWNQIVGWSETYGRCQESQGRYVWLLPATRPQLIAATDRKSV